MRRFRTEIPVCDKMETVEEEDNRACVNRFSLYVF